MRPIPARKHHWAVLALLAVVAINTWVTFRATEVTGNQANLMTEVHKREDPGLFANDDVFASSPPTPAWRLHLPAWQALLGGALHWGQDDPLNAFRIVGTLALLVYLTSMYILLYRQTHSTSAATFVAILSMAVFSIRRGHWGVGPLASVTPETLFLAVVPLLAQAFLRARSRPTLLLVFLLAGVCANIDFSSGVNLVIVLLVALLGLGRLGWKAWAAAGLSACAAGVGALPAILHYWDIYRAAGPQPVISAAVLREALKVSGMNLLYPQVLADAVRWLPLALVLALPAGVILSRAGRYRLQDLGGWLWLLGAPVIVALGILAVVQLIAWSMGTLPIRADLFDALRLGMLPLYVLFAQSTVHLLRAARTHQAWVKAGLGVFLLVYLGSSYNTWPIRRLVQDGIAWVAGGERPGRERTSDQELCDIGLWARQATPKDALFVNRNEEIRLYGRRSLYACASDFQYLRRLAPQRLAEWVERLKRQHQLLSPPEGARASVDHVTAFVDTYWRGESLPPAATYLVFPAAGAPVPSGRVQEIPAPDGKWGSHWRVLRVLPPAPAAATQG